ncbi:DUF2752 domain-containing protein [bacterium]|nr:DUF2752 domain-containing protein [bacterium]
MTSKQKWRFAAGAIFCVVGLGLLTLYNPSESLIFPNCPFHYMTGLYCPGCGTLRAIHQLLQGHFWRAFAYNPILIVLTPVIGLLLFERYSADNHSLISSSPKFQWVIFVVLMAYWILRNIPITPFSYLAPGGLLLI